MYGLPKQTSTTALGEYANHFSVDAIVPLACLKYAELNVAVWVGCVPTLQPLFRKIFGPGSTLPDPNSNQKRSYPLLNNSGRSKDTGVSANSNITVKSDYTVLNENV